MLSKENYGLEHLMELRQSHGMDPNLLERVLYAFGLLEAISSVEMPFIFKGGSSLILLESLPRRLSTDIDILVQPGTDIDRYIRDATKIFPFKRFEESKRRVANSIEKRHFKFFYDSPLRSNEFYILLDVVFAESPYQTTISKTLNGDLFINEGIPSTVTIPSPDCILADKLTAFAPHTTGILLESGKTLEIMKQLYDISTLTDFISDQAALQNTYGNVVTDELAYRDLSLTQDDVLMDTIKACTCIIGKGSIDGDDYPMYLRGIQSLDSHVMKGRYTGEIAAYQACKAMYLAATIITKSSFHRISNPAEYATADIEKSRFKKLRYIKKQNPESFGYLVEAIKLLQE